MRVFSIALIALFASVSSASAATLTYSGIQETLLTDAKAVAGQAGGVFDTFSDSQSLAFYANANSSDAVDLDTQTGAFASANGRAGQTTVLLTNWFQASGSGSYRVEVALGAIAYGKGESTLAFNFTSDEDVDIQVGATVFCQGGGCEASIQVLGSLGVGTLLDVSSQQGTVSDSLVRHILAGEVYSVIARVSTDQQLMGAGIADSNGTFNVTLSMGSPGGVPEPGVAPLFAFGLIALAFCRSRRY